MNQGVTKWLHANLHKIIEMESITAYFSDIPSSHRSVILVGGLAFFFILENVAPFFKGGYNKWKHSGINIFFTLTTIVVNFVMAFLLFLAAEWVVSHNFGLLQWVEMSLPLQLIIGLLVMDLVGAYTVHWIEHKVTWMWQFHVIHHTDQNIDSTTANRHHPGESVIRFTFAIIAVLVTGAPIWLVFLYQTLSAFLSQFNHSNLNLPVPIDNVLKLVICTPHMHRVHHHFRQPYSDSNYGNIFSFWDRIFGTYVAVDNNKLVYGVDTYMKQEDVESVSYLLKLPFAGYRKPLHYDKEERLKVKE